MDPIGIVEIVATAIVLVGVYLISIPNIKGLYCMFISQILWAVFAYSKGFKFLLLQSVILFLINIRGIYNWRKKGIK
jgi:nicotinamide riboside transporter PnuC